MKFLEILIFSDIQVLYHVPNNLLDTMEKKYPMQILSVTHLFDDGSPINGKLYVKPIRKNVYREYE